MTPPTCNCLRNCSNPRADTPLSIKRQMLIAFLQLPHDHMSLYADYSPYLVDPPERFVEMLRDMEKDDPE